MRIEHFEDGKVPVVDDGVGQHLVVELLEDHRAALSERLSGRLRGIPRRREVPLEVLERALLLLVRGGDGDAPDLRSLDDVDDAPVGDLRHGEAGEAASVVS